MDGGSIVGPADEYAVTILWGDAGTGRLKVEYSEVQTAVAEESDELEVTIHGTPNIPSISAPSAVCSGSRLSLRPPVILSHPGNYDAVTGLAWKLNGENFTPGNTPVPASQNGQGLLYEATNACGTSQSNTVAITVHDLPTVTVIPQSVCLGEAVELSNAIANPANYTAIRFYTELSGGSFLDETAVVPLTDPATYYVEVENAEGCTNAVREEIEVTFYSTTFIHDHPVAPGIPVGRNNPFSLSVSATGDDLVYRWYRYDDTGNPATEVSVANNSTYTVSAAQETDYGHYFVVVSGDCGALTSDTVTVHVLNPDATLQDLRVNNVTVPGFAPQNTEYTVILNCDLESADIAGTPNDPNLALIQLPNVSLEIGDNRFEVTVTAENGFTQKTYTVNVIRECYVPRIEVDLEDAIICKGDSHTFKIEAEGENLSYEWYYGNERIAGANTNQYTVRNAELKDYERYYVIVRSNFNGYKASTYSRNVRLWVSDQLPEKLAFIDLPTNVVTGKTYRVKLAGYEDVTKYSWSYDKPDVIFTPEEGKIGENETWATFGTLSAGSGKITVTLEHPCGTRQVSSSIEVRYPLGIDRLTDANVQLYPNPTAGLIHISNTEANQLIRVLDASGAVKKTLFSVDGTTTVDLKPFAKGSYVVQYGGKVFKVVKR